MIQIRANITNLDFQSAILAAGLSVVSGAPVSVAYTDGIPTASAVGGTASVAYPCFQGTDSLANNASGHIPVIMRSGFVFDTDQYDASASWTLGADVTAKDGKWTVAAAGEPVMGRVVGVPTVSNAVVTIFFKG